MFGFKKAKMEVTSPINGEAIPISSTPDPVFADKILGDGVAIIPADGMVCAPADATVQQVAHTLHAIGLMTDSGLEILIHLGMDTVKLNGEGFTCLVEVGQKVKKGDQMMKMDLELIKSKGYETISPCILTNLDDLSVEPSFTTGPVVAGETVVISCSKK